MTRWRRLVRDYEQSIDVSHAMTLVAMPSRAGRTPISILSDLRLRFEGTFEE